MKKNLLIGLMFLALHLGAQTPLTQAVDFTAKDVYGNTFNLFSKLNEGKFVFVDFFFTNCGPCQQTAPRLHQAFLNYGANSPNAQVFFVTINRDDNNAVLQNWEAQYMSPTGPYPLGISGTQGSETGGPQSFSSLYGITAYPTMILIAPNKQIVEQDIWPVPTVASFDPFFSAHGITQMPSSVAAVNETPDFNLSPNPSQDFIYLNASVEPISGVRVFDLIGKTVLSEQFSKNLTTSTISVSVLPKGIYTMEVSFATGKKAVKKFIKN